MESAFRAALIDWLAADSELAASLNAFAEEGPSASPAPALSVVASASSDWSTKTATGREVRIALELLDRSDAPENTAAIVARIEQRIATLSPVQAGFRVVVTRFLRSRAERRAREMRAVLLEYSFKLLENPTE